MPGNDVQAARLAGRRVMMMQTQAENAGAQEVSRLLGEGLEKRGYDVHHLFFFRRTDSGDALPNVIFCASERPKSLPQLFALLRRLRQAVGKARPDIVLTFQHYGNILGAAATRSVGAIPVIANQVSPDGVTNRLIRFTDRWFGRLGLYDGITVNSDDTARAFVDHPEVYRRRIVHIPHGFMDKTAAFDKAEARRRLGLPPEVVLLGTAARLHPIKNLEAGLRLLPFDPAWHLALAGQGPDRERLQGLASELGVAERLHLVGELPSAEVGGFLAALDVFLFPSVAETFGLAGVEAAQAGVPVVCNDLPVLREVLAFEGRPAALFVDVADSKAFAAAVAKVLNEPELARDLTSAGRGLASRYPLSAMVDAFENLIQNVLKGRG